MNYRNICAVPGMVLVITGISMLFPALWSLYYGDYDWPAFLWTGGVTVILGLTLYKVCGITGAFQAKEAFAAVVLSWVAAAGFGALPFLLSGTLPTFGSALFEAMSGFTTTGASVFSDVEILPHGVLFWRSFTHWLGGMGIIVLFVAVLSSLGVNALSMFKAESPGPVIEKITPRISATAKILWYIYIGMTIVLVVILYALGMPLFDSLCHAFGTVATGGFSIKNLSIGYYANPLIHWVIIAFMFLAGINFVLYYLALKGKDLRVFWKDGEFRLYARITLVFIAVIAVTLLWTTNYSSEAALRHAAFQVVSIMTTTGYATADFDLWTTTAKAMLVILMFVGGCAGSTSGSIKVGRMLILLKQGYLELQRVLHPRSVTQIRINGKAVRPELVMNVQQFFFIYVFIAAVSVTVMSALGLDPVSAFTAVAATLGNVGPGLAEVGPMRNYALVPEAGKYYLSFLMLAGRLELYTLLVLFLPSFWRK
ncbi:MAG: TrkH family potassium uptake protein [Clostridia bacterium]|jgi:trk system potassium uptake protein TrkH|nr:TrkH family potassium uptake protein [Clostridia bacterium]